MSNTDVEITSNEDLEALQEAAEQFYKCNDGDLFLVASEQCLENNNSRLLFNFLQDEQHRQLVNFVGWDLVKIVFRFLSDENEPENNFQNILHLICNSCSAREICLSLGEVLSCRLLTWQKMISLLQLLQRTCQRLEGKIAKIFSSILFSLTRFLRNREHKYDHLPEILEITLEFLRPYIAKVQNSKDAKELVVEIKSFLVNLLDFPFAQLEFLPGDGELCKFRGYSETIVQWLACIEGNSLKHLLAYSIHKNKICNSDDENGLPYIGLGCLGFLMHVKNIGLHFLPVVLTGRYIFETTVVYINMMLCNDHINVVTKGLQLLLAIFNLINSESLEHIFSGELPGILTKLMTHCEDSNIRQQAVNALCEMLNKLQRRAKYKHLRLLNQTCYHSGMAEFIILLLKKEIVKSLQDEDKWFSGGNLASFLREIFCVPPKVFQSEYGLVEDKSRILAALNLFRYMFIRDKKNQTMIHTMTSELETSYFKPLMNAVTLSKQKLKESIKIKKDELSGKVAISKDEEVFSVATSDGSELEMGSLQQQLNCLESAELAVIMIESMLVRINEISTNKKEPKAYCRDL